MPGDMRNFAHQGFACIGRRQTGRQKIYSAVRVKHSFNAVPELLLHAVVQRGNSSFPVFEQAQLAAAGFGQEGDGIGFFTMQGFIDLRQKLSRGRIMRVVFNYNCIGVGQRSNGVGIIQGSGNDHDVYMLFSRAWVMCHRCGVIQSKRLSQKVIHASVLLRDTIRIRLGYIAVILSMRIMLLSLLVLILVLVLIIMSGIIFSRVVFGRILMLTCHRYSRYSRTVK